MTDDVSYKDMVYAVKHGQRQAHEGFSVRV
jgi:hypothetical protein